MNCTNATDSLACLRAVPVDVLSSVFNSSVTASASFGTQIDGDFIRESSITSLSEGRFVKVPLLVGTNFDEGAMFGTKGVIRMLSSSLLSRLLARTMSLPTPSRHCTLIYQPLVYLAHWKGVHRRTLPMVTNGNALQPTVVTWPSMHPDDSCLNHGQRRT